MDRSENNRITMVIIDASAFHDVNNDFIGVNSELLPSFFAELKERGIILLKHPVLDGEIKKHIGDSSLVRNQQQLILYLQKAENMIKIAGGMSDELINKIKTFDIRRELYKGYLDSYKDAVQLDYPMWDSVFDKYFKAIPPFSESGKKKSEFPDAVIIESVNEYLEEHENERLLVVSRDSDWKNAFANNKSVCVVDSILNALQQVNKVNCVLDNEMINDIFNSAIEEIKKEVIFNLKCECFDVPDYEFEKDFETSSIEVVYIDDLFTVLRASRNQMLIQTEVDVHVSGSGIIIDEDRSIWNDEDRCYWLRYLSQLNVTKGIGSVKVEIRIEFDFDNPMDVTVDEVKVLNMGNIDLDLVEFSIDPI